jgi:hypothetical protein
MLHGLPHLSKLLQPYQSARQKYVISLLDKLVGCQKNKKKFMQE